MQATALSARQLREETNRAIVLRSRGLTHGPITRLVSPGDIGELIKPFVFLDYFEADPANAPQFGFHPHSGIATWTWQPPRGHDIAWIASHKGVVVTPERVSKGEVVVFAESEQAITFEALEDAGFVLGCAVKHPYDLVTGYYSVHTNREALRRGENNIAAIGRRLHDQGVLGRGQR